MNGGKNRKNEIERNDKNDKNWIIWTGNNIGESGARMISEALKTNTTLTILGLMGDEIEVNEKKKYKKKQETRNINKWRGEKNRKNEIERNDKKW